MALGIENTGIKGEINIYRLYQNGHREHRQTVKNVVINNGLQRILDNLVASGAVVDRFSYGHSGTDLTGSVVAKSAASSGLSAEDATKAIDGYLRISNTLYVTCTIAAAEGNTVGSINEFGIYYSGTNSVNRFVAMQSFNTELKDASFAIQFEHALTVANV